MASTHVALGDLLDLVKAGVEADVYERYDGDPGDAIDEHVAELRDEKGTSILVGFLSDDVTDEDEEGTPLGADLTAAILIVRRRGHRVYDAQDAGGATVGTASADAEKLDGLYDDTINAVAGKDVGGARLFIRNGRALSGDGNWYGRALTVRFSRDFDPSLD